MRSRGRRAYPGSLSSTRSSPSGPVSPANASTTWSQPRTRRPSSSTWASNPMSPTVSGPRNSERGTSSRTAVSTGAVPTFPDLAQRARTARRAISLRSAGVSDRARARPPFFAPSRPSSRPALLAFFGRPPSVPLARGLSPGDLPTRASIERTRASKIPTRVSTGRTGSGAIGVGRLRVVDFVGPAPSVTRWWRIGASSRAPPPPDGTGVTGARTQCVTDGADCAPRPSAAGGPSVYFARFAGLAPGQRWPVSLEPPAGCRVHGGTRQTIAVDDAVSMKGRLTVEELGSGNEAVALLAGR